MVFEFIDENAFKLNHGNSISCVIKYDTMLFQLELFCGSQLVFFLFFNPSNTIILNQIYNDMFIYSFSFVSFISVHFSLQEGF